MLQLPSLLLFRLFRMLENRSSVGSVTSVLRRLFFFAMFMLIQNLNNIGGRDGCVDVNDPILGVRIAADRARLGVCRGEAPRWRALGAVHLHKEIQIKLFDLR